MRTFIHHDGALGDVLLSLPCLRSLRAGGGFVQIAGRRDVVRFLAQAGVVHAGISSDAALFASLYAEPDPPLRTFLAGFDRACVFTADGDFSASALVSSGILPAQIVRTVPPPGSGIHAAAYRLSQLISCARPSEAFSPFDIPGAQLGTAHNILKKAGINSERALIAIHPGSGGRPKCWPLERYFELAERLQSANDPFTLIFSGPAEDDYMKKRIEAFAAGRSQVLHASCVDLMPAAALLKICDLYIGNDSGFSHLAGATGCASLVLFGPTDPGCWRPIGPGIQVISEESGSLEHMPVDAVLEAARSIIAGRGPHNQTHLLRFPQASDIRQNANK